MISQAIIEEVNRSPPRCSYCNRVMNDYHSKMWNGMGYTYISIEFRCNQVPTHYFVLKARTLEEWNSHIKRIEENDKEKDNKSPLVS